MNRKLNWQRLQVSMNNFKINRLMSYTDIKNKLKLALNYANKSDSKYANVKKIAALVNKLDAKNDFIQDNPSNQKRFKAIAKLINPLVGYAKVKDPTTAKLNHLFKQASQKEPKTMKQFNLRAHKQNHMSAQQAMLQAMGIEIKAETHKK